MDIILIQKGMDILNKVEFAKMTNIILSSMSANSLQKAKRYTKAEYKRRFNQDAPKMKSLIKESTIYKNDETKYKLTYYKMSDKFTEEYLNELCKIKIDDYVTENMYGRWLCENAKWIKLNDSFTVCIIEKYYLNV